MLPNDFKMNTNYGVAMDWPIEYEDLRPCLLYTSDAADERSSVDLGGRRIIKKKKTDERSRRPHNGHKDTDTGDR